MEWDWVGGEEGGFGIGMVGGGGGLGMGDMGMRGLRDGNCMRRKERL